jgi:hypothetical protein
MTGRPVRGTAAIVVVLLAGMVLAGCGRAADEASNGVAEEPARTASDRQGAGDTTGERPRVQKVGVPARAVIHTGRLELEVRDVADAADTAIRIAEDADGYVGKDSRDVSDSSDGAARAVVTLRIPAATFQANIRRLATLGKELEREITAEDVSESMVDLDTRIATMRASVKRMRALLNQARSIGDISTVERELSTREAELASLESRRRNLGNQVTYSNITVTFVTPHAAPTAPTKIGFGSGLAAGWDAFTMSVRVLLTILGAILPFLMYGVPVLALVLLVRRLSRRARVLPSTGQPVHRPES